MCASFSFAVLHLSVALFVHFLSDWWSGASSHDCHNLMNHRFKIDFNSVCFVNEFELC